MSSQRRCILHIGTMKTGTTAIQSWLKENQTWLKGQGWHYPGPPPLREAAAIAAVVDQLADDQNLVISDEGLWHYSSATSSHQSDTAAIREILSDFDVTLICYLRRPDEFLESWFAQGLKNGSGEHDVHRFLAAGDTAASRMIYRLNVFTGLWDDDCFAFRPYEQAQFENGDLISDFVAHSGMPVPPPKPDSGDGSGRHNVTPTADQLLMAGLLRKLGQVPRKQIQELLSVPASPEAGAGHRLFTAEEAERIRAEYRPVYRNIQRRWGSGASDDFIIDWGELDTRPVAALRPVYDHVMAQLDTA